MRPCFEALNDYSLIKYQNYPCFVIIEIVLRDHLLKKKKIVNCIKFLVGCLKKNNILVKSYCYCHSEPRTKELCPGVK